MIAKDKFYSDGYSLCRKILNKSVIDSLSLELSKFARLGRNPYIYESEVIQSVVFGREIQKLSAQILGDRYIYLPDYSFNALNFWSAFGWHKDSVDRYDMNGPDWDSNEFPIIRFGIYLGDYTLNTGSLGIQKGSNKGVLYANSGINVKTMPGDIVVWPLTTTHTANSPAFKLFPKTALTPLINSKTIRGFVNKLGNFVNKTEIGLQKNLPNRQVLFFTVAKPGPHLARYMSYLIHREYFRDFILSDPEQGEIHSSVDIYSEVNWLRVKGLLGMADKKLISNDFDQKKAQASSEVLFSELNVLFKEAFE